MPALNERVMIDPVGLSPETRLYLRPIWFADSPVGLDGRAARLAGGLIWFQGYEVTARADGGLLRDQVSVADFEGWCDGLSAPLARRARQLAANISAPRPPLRLGDRVIRFDTPQVMGIVNSTPDSFSDGGKYADDPSIAADAGFTMMERGAAIVDVGGESTRPGADTVWEGDEIARIVPVIERLAASGTPVSIDTRKAGVMEAALRAGAHIVNDVSALLHDPRSMDVVREAGCPVVLMHASSVGDNPHENPRYQDVVTDVYDWLEERVTACEAAGIARDKIIIDPGVGFGKGFQGDLAIINRLALYQAMGLPLLLGVSRKRVIGALSHEAAADKRLGGSLALAQKGIEAGVQIVRVHDVPETVQMVHVWRGLRDAALLAG